MPKHVFKCPLCSVTFTVASGIILNPIITNRSLTIIRQLHRIFDRYCPRNLRFVTAKGHVQINNKSDAFTFAQMFERNSSILFFLLPTSPVQLWVKYQCRLVFLTLEENLFGRISTLHSKALKINRKNMNSPIVKERNIWRTMIAYVLK